MQSINWYAKRLGAMSGREILFRLHRSVRVHAQRWRQYRPPKESRRISETVARWLPRAPRVAPEPYLRAAEDIVAGKLQIFVHEAVDYDDRISWNRDPRTGGEAPLAYSKTLDYRDSDRVGDIKYLWEPNRHLHFVTLAQAYNLSGDRRFLDTLENHVSSWIKQSPYLRGVNWVSGLELGIRLINWSIAWQLVTESGEISRDLRDRWIESIYLHCRHIKSYFSRFSSANNHLIGEAAGLFIASCTWPYWNESERWRRKSLAILEEEIQKQIGSDGVGLEQAISYQQFILDFLILAGLAGRSYGVEFSGPYWSRVESALEFVGALLDVEGNVPMIGDADDGYVSNLAPDSDFCPYRSLLATGAVLFRRTEFARLATTLDDKTRWILGDEVSDQWLERTNADDDSLPTSFEAGGYFLLGRDLGTRQEIRLLIDAGPLGYETIAAHGHADALSVYLSVFGDEVLIDPGTYAYHTKREWRDYFRGTASHNTLEIDGRDQSEPGGDFLWTTHANTKVLAHDADKGLFVGEHDGYQRLDDPVVHRRKIEFDERTGRIDISDEISAVGRHAVARWWHFSEHCDVTLPESGVIVATTERAEVVLRATTPKVADEIFRGSTNPIAGWVSRRFDEKKETTSVVWRCDHAGSVTMNCSIEIRPLSGR